MGRAWPLPLYITGRRITHFVLHCTVELDEELFEWVSQAYQFAQIK